MTVGETLTEARNHAGLSVDELSERTRIRETVIRSIERDDYDACGGDLYVRGYVRALAGAVGIDAQPLIREFDQGRASDRERASGSTGRHALGYPLRGEPTVASPVVPGPVVPGPVVASPEAAATQFDLPSVPVEDEPPADGEPAAGDDPEVTRYDLPPVSADPDTTRFDLPLVAPLPPPATRPAAGTGTRDLMAAGYDLGPPGGTGPSAAAPPARRPRRRALIGAIAVVAVLVAAGALVISLNSGDGGRAAAASASASARAAAAVKASAAAQASASAQASQSAAAQASASAQASQASAKKKAAQQAAASRVVALPVASARAFGPDGFADGDNPENAGYATARHPVTPWSTQWYVTPTYGMLKHGTGLLLDLGRTVTVSSVRADLSQYGGATVQLRAGSRAQLADLRVAATAANASGAVKLTLRHPVTARYLLLWFTVLPSDGAGHYQESVTHVAVSGHR